VNQTTPAIVAQGAVRRLPRVALLLLCIAYVLPGFLGRGPWRGADITAFGYMAELAHGGTSWYSPLLLGQPPEVDALLPYWLGAWSMQLAPAWVSPDLAARIPFLLLLTLTLFATWYATYYLARSPEAQPVAFAFGGEALPADYARAMADGGLLAFIACLGLAQLSHETTPALAQLCFTALFFYALAALPYRIVTPAIGGVLGLSGLALSGAPAMATLLGAGCALIHLLDRATSPEAIRLKIYRSVAIAVLTISIAVLATGLDLWRWRFELPVATWTKWRSLGRLLLWFTWPAWPLALWTLWRWRQHLLRGGATSRHLALPLWFVSVAVVATLTTASADRSLLLALPALAALAAFALPTLRRSVAALIDWFTLLFFTACAFIIWVVWIAMQTGIPKQPAANVVKLAPGFVHSFSVLPFCIAIAATLAWAWLVKWRVGGHRSAIWKSLVLPAGGAALCWLLLMTLWLPLLDYARSYAPLVRRAIIVMKQKPNCVEQYRLSRGQIAAFQFHAQIDVTPVGRERQCPWLIVDKDALNTLPDRVDLSHWAPHSTMRHPADKNEDILIYKRLTQR
jgi:hypothetical protein